ncbi:MAG: hypothetical protein ABSG59_04345 [Verrucomicrobiota bacterium]|jgi:hypothetical protein
MQLARCVWLVIFCAAAPVLPSASQGLSWRWSNPQPHGNDIVSMAWNGTLGVQVCELGRVYTSPNLIDWFPQNSNLTNDLQAVTFFRNRIIITGSRGAVAYSDDGVNFTAISLNTTNWIVSVAASSNLVVAVGDAGALYTSTDGATWHLQPAPPYLGPYWLLSVAYGDGIFVTTGEQGYIATSGNGTNWTARSIYTGYGELEDVTWINTSGSHTNFPYTGFWTVSDAGYAFYSTTNGAAWTQFTLNSSTNVLYTAAADNATGLLAGDNEARLGSAVSNKVTWPEQIGAAQTDVPTWTYFTAVMATNGVYELAGYDGLLVESSQTNGNYSWDTPYSCARDWLWQVALTNGLYVAVGDNARIMTSDDGADWTIEEVPLTNSVSASNTAFFCVGGTSNFLVAAGTRGSLAVSPNVLVPLVETNDDGSLFTNYSASSLGVIWYSLPAPAGTTNDLAGIGVFSNNFFLVGGNGTLLNSPDGTNWSKVASGTSNYLSGIAAFTNGLLVLTGNQGAILTSPDGINWTSRASGTTNWLYRLRCLNGGLLAVGENGVMLSSTNGTNWSSVRSGVTNFLNDAVMISNTCYVVGDQGIVLVSTNFTTWTNIGAITTKSLEGAATQNGQLLVVGFEGTILRSQVVPVLTPVNFVDYSQVDGYNVFLVSGVLDQQFTLDSSTNFVNWETGPLQDLIYGDGTLVFYEPLPDPAPTNQFYRCTLVP